MNSVPSRGEARRNGAADRVAREAFGVIGHPGEADLGGDEHALSAPADGLSNDALRLAVVVDVGGIEEDHAPLYAAREDPLGQVRARALAEVHGPQGEPDGLRAFTGRDPGGFQRGEGRAHHPRFYQNRCTPLAIWDKRTRELRARRTNRRRSIRD